MLKHLAGALAVGLAVGALAVAPADGATGLTCAATTNPSTPASPSGGQPCWTQVTPYPFGFDGNPVDPTGAACQQSFVNPNDCYLTVNSMAFRAWNRGLAAVSAATGSATPYGVWLYNGTRWYPDPTFPGSSVCQGDRVLWAGKLDYWLIGNSPQGSAAWPSLCRFDGANYDWEPLAVPKAAIPYVASAGGRPTSGAINAGSCYAWNNCWFFGSYGVTLHWDGQSLTPAWLGQPGSPWLQANVMAAVAGTDAAGNPFGLAVAAARSDYGHPGETNATAVPTQPDGSPAPQLFGSQGGPFAALGSSAPAGAQDATDLVATGANDTGDVWVAGDPANYNLNPAGQPVISPPHPLTAPAPAPLEKVSTAGSALDCPGVSSSSFSYQTASDPEPFDQYVWTSIAVFPDGEALAGGQMVPSSDPVHPKPVLEQALCDGQPTGTVLAQSGFSITSVAATASNDAWAGAASGSAPALYHLTDGQTPDAPPGNDDESRPAITTTEPTIFVNPPPIIVPPPPTPTVVVTVPPATKVVLKPAIYAITRTVKRSGRIFILYITFRVRRAVTIGIEALRHKKVVSSSGLKAFKPPRGVLALRLNPHAWPTSIRFVTPKATQ